MHLSENRAKALGKSPINCTFDSLHKIISIKPMDFLSLLIDI